MTDELRNRLSRLDPVPSEVAMEPVTSQSSQHLLEEIMTDQEVQDVQPEPGNKVKKSWYAAVAAAVAAAAVVIIAIGAVGIFTGGEEEDPVAAGPPLELSAGDRRPGDDDVHHVQRRGAGQGSRSPSRAP